MQLRQVAANEALHQRHQIVDFLGGTGPVLGGEAVEREIGDAELVFIDAYWPDFGRELLVDAIAQYRARERRFGGLSQQSLG